MFDAKQAREKIVKPVLHGIGMWNEYAEELMMGTLAVESQGGTYLVQQNAGPALGVFQMEPATHDDIWQKWLPNHPAIANNLMQSCMISMKPAAAMMVSNLFYACAMARIEYFRNTAAPIPATLEEQAEFWVKYYNRGSQATPEKFISAYRSFLGIEQPKAKAPKAK